MTMKVDVFFGSASDEAVFNRLLDALSDLQIEYRFEVCSAHRNPDKLSDLVKASNADLFIAGAGLSAHLPGAVAAHSLKPVIALPCTDVMKGLDALLASMQMPGGVPVLASGVENIAAIQGFLSQYRAIRHETPVVTINAPDSALKLTETFASLLQPYPFRLTKSAQSSAQEGIMVYVVNLLAPESFSSPPPNTICIPYLSEDKPWDPRTLQDLTAKGGLWVGINNAKNAALALIQLWNQGHQWDHDLQCHRGGVPAHA